jgi:hypothetical protein
METGGIDRSAIAEAAAAADVSIASGDVSVRSRTSRPPFNQVRYLEWCDGLNKIAEARRSGNTRALT